MPGKAAAPDRWRLAAASGRKQQRRVDVVAPNRLREAHDATYAAMLTATDALTAAPTRRTAREMGSELCVEPAGVCWLDRSSLTRVLGRTVARAGDAAVRPPANSQTSACRGMKIVTRQGSAVRSRSSGSPGTGDPCCGERGRARRFGRWASSPCFSVAAPATCPGALRARIGLCRSPTRSPVVVNRLTVIQ
jgi:hypothetical protein